jgi:hypothetical protein
MQNSFFHALLSAVCNVRQTMSIGTILSVSVFGKLRSTLEIMPGSVHNRIHAVPSSEHQRIAVDHVYTPSAGSWLRFSALRLCVRQFQHTGSLWKKEIWIIQPPAAVLQAATRASLWSHQQACRICPHWTPAWDQEVCSRLTTRREISSSTAGVYLWILV